MWGYGRHKSSRKSQLVTVPSSPSIPCSAPELPPSLPPSPTLQGTRSSKKKKERKLNRVMYTVKKAARKGQESHSESFAALHLMHDPQTFAEKLFSRMQTGHEKFETRMAMIQVVSRVVGVHK